jgi:Flp pilus assembly protein TadG
MLYKQASGVAGAKSQRVARRSGTAAVEMAFVAPILFALIFGSIDFGRAMMVANLLTNTCREGARLATLPGTAYSDVTTQINSQLTAQGISQTGMTTTVALNGTTVTDLSTAKTGDSIKVSLTLPYDNVSYMPTSWFMKGKNLGGQAVMVKQ